MEFGSSRYLFTNNNIFSTTNWSLSTWVYTTTLTGLNSSSSSQCLICNRTATGLGIAVFLMNGGSVRIDNMIDNASKQKTMNYTYPINTWFHLCAVCNNSTVRLYINGELKDSQSITGTTLANLSNYTMIGVSCVGNGSVNNNLCGKLNDYRIYDECLSPREIKEISKGLVLHYPLNREGFGVDNICKNKDVNLTGSDFGSYNTRSYDTENHIGKIQVTDTSHRWNAWKFGPSDLDTTCQELTTGTNTYTVSVDIRVTNYTTGSIACAFDFRTNSTVSASALTLLTGEQCDGNWHRVSCSLTTNDTQNNSCLWCIHSNGSTHGSQTTIEYKNWKLERGSKATPWIPHKTDELYSKMGLNICNENLLSKSSLNPSNWRHIYPSCTSYTGDGYDNMFEMVTTASYENVFLPVAVTSGQQYTLSVTYQVLDSFSLWQSSRPFSFQVLSAVPTNSDTFNNVLGSILLGNTAMSTPQRGSTTFTPTGDTVWLNIPGSYYKDGSSSYNKRVKFSYFKLEKGATATPWVSATSDSEKFGNTVFDTSGYRYDGIYAKFDETGSFSWRGDSPRYNVACQLNSDGVTNYNRTGAAFIRGTVPITTPNTLTVAFWCYGQLSYGNGYHGLFCTSSNTTASDYQASALNHRDNGFDVNSSDGKTHLRLSLGIIVGEWHHYAITYDGQIARSYRDGVLQDINNFSSATALGSFQYVFLGLSGAGGAYRKSVASYSDFRLYVTALSVEDILKLYNTPITLSNNGTLLTQGEYSEV